MQALYIGLLIVIGILLFSFIIFFHELGHFLFAKLAGIRVNEFALGMGPRLWGFRRGETTYSLRLLPVGGFCAMEGEDEASSDPGAFGYKPAWKRMLVVVAGGVFNIILGFVMMLFLLAPQEMFGTTIIAQFTEGSALSAAGAKEGDRILEIDGYQVNTDKDMGFALALADPNQVHMVVERDGARVDLGTFAMHRQELEGRNVVAMDFYVLGEKRSVPVVLRRAVADTFSTTRMVLESLNERDCGAGGPSPGHLSGDGSKPGHWVWRGPEQYVNGDGDNHREPGHCEPDAPACPGRGTAVVFGVGGSDPQAGARQV